MIQTRLIRVTLLYTLLSAPVLTAEPDSDHDGVADAKDRCPDTAQLKKVPPDFRYKMTVNPERLKPGPQAHPVDEHGCELDSDGDGVINSHDYCPKDTPEMISAGVAANGCARQSDADGTPDYRDDCPDTPKGVKTDAKGCPVEKPAAG